MFVDRAQLSWHAFVKHSCHELLVILREWPLTIVELFRQVQANNIAAVLLKKARKMLLCAKVSFVFSPVNNDVWLWCQGAGRLRPKEGH